jgi:hypothetical protein
VFKGFINLVDDATCLFSGGVSLSEAELVGRDLSIVLEDWKEPSEE